MFAAAFSFLLILLMPPMYHRLRAHALLRVFIFELRGIGRGEELELWWSFTLYPPSLELFLRLISYIGGCWGCYEWLERVQ